MRAFESDHYLSTPQGLLAQRRRRFLRRIYFDIDAVEPRAKHSMPESDKDEVQRQLLKSLAKRRRKAFRGPLALRVTVATTEKTPTHSHHIAKNLLDLFAKPRLSLATRQRGLLYTDDSQVHALSVTCHHGEDTPMISAHASPLGSLLADLDLVRRHGGEHREDHAGELADDFDGSVYNVQRMLHEEGQLRPRLGDRRFDSMLLFLRQRAQECLLGRGTVTPFDLAMLYDVSGRAFGHPTWSAMWEQTFASSPLRIQLSELPQVRRSSTSWKEEIEAKLHAFQTQFGWLVDPLLVPVTLEVVIKPPPPSRQNGLHDLDNVLRTYLIPRVVDILKPVSHYAFAYDGRTDKSRNDVRVAAGMSLRLAMPPASTKFGISRYEAWRLPPAKADSKGFVSVGIVAASTKHGDSFAQIDRIIEQWSESVDERL